MSHTGSTPSCKWILPPMPLARKPLPSYEGILNKISYDDWVAYWLLIGGTVPVRLWTIHLITRNVSHDDECTGGSAPSAIQPFLSVEKPVWLPTLGGDCRATYLNLHILSAFSIFSESECPFCFHEKEASSYFFASHLIYSCNSRLPWLPGLGITAPLPFWVSR